MDQASVGEVIAKLAEFTATPVVRISLSTRLSQDLGIDGDDAGEFLFDWFFPRFHIDPAEFPFEAYFATEEWGCLLSPFSLERRSPTYLKRPVTVEHLIRCAEAGRWLPVG